MMGVGYFSNQVVPGSIQNLDTGEVLEFLFNPTQIQRTIAVNYSRQQTIGGSFEHLHFKTTGNVQIPLRLFFSLAAFIESHRGGGSTLSSAALDQIRTDFEAQRNFFVALCYPAGRADDPIRRAPPKALLLWPKNVALEVVVTRYQDTDTRFSTEADTMIFTIDVALEESRRWRLTSSKARQIGFRRTTGNSQRL